MAVEQGQHVDYINCRGVSKLRIGEEVGEKCQSADERDAKRPRWTPSLPVLLAKKIRNKS